MTLESEEIGTILVRELRLAEIEGRTAYLCARKISDNPYQFGTAEGMDWELAWVEAAQLGLPKYN